MRSRTWPGARPTSARAWRRGRSRCKSGCWCWAALCAVCPASAGNIVAFAFDCSAPDDHLGASPHCGVRASVIRCIDSSSRHPGIRSGVVSPAVVQKVLCPPAPDDHLGAGPHCCMKISGLRGIRGTSRCPTVFIRVVPTTGVERVAN